MRPHPHFAGYRDPSVVIAAAVWLCFRFPLSLRTVGAMLAARGITVSHETMTKRFKSARQAQRLLSIHDPIANLFNLRRDHRPIADDRTARAQAFEAWADVAGARLAT